MSFKSSLKLSCQNPICESLFQCQGKYYPEVLFTLNALMLTYEKAFATKAFAKLFIVTHILKIRTIIPNTSKPQFY